MKTIYGLINKELSFIRTNLWLLRDFTAVSGKYLVYEMGMAEVGIELRYYFFPQTNYRNSKQTLPLTV